MSNIPVLEKENTIRIKATFSDDNDQVVEPDNAEAFIEIVNMSNGTTVVSESTMTNISDTQYQFDWTTTSGTEEGEFFAMCQAEISSDTISNKERFRLDDIV